MRRKSQNLSLSKFLLRFTMVTVSSWIYQFGVWTILITNCCCLTEEELLDFSEYLNRIVRTSVVMVINIFDNDRYKFVYS